MIFSAKEIRSTTEKQIRELDSSFNHMTNRLACLERQLLQSRAETETAYSEGFRAGKVVANHKANVKFRRIRDAVADVLK